MKTKPVVFGISGLSLTEEEISFFKKSHPFGYILFSRNIESSKQLRKLTKDLKEINPSDNVRLFVDQEGGRVQRIKAPLAANRPSAEHFSDIYRDDNEKGKRATEKNYIYLMNDLKSFGIDSPCAPVCDLRFPETNNIIGDRSFGNYAKQAIDLCKSAITGIVEAGGIAFLKHIPGHGRATIDSHLDLPVVDTPLKELEKTDFAVFKELAKEFAQEQVWGMSAHIIFTSLDKDHPATLSKKVIAYIRDKIGFKNKLFTDDLCMYALHGEVGQRHQLLKSILKLIADNKNWDGQTKSFKELFNIDLQDKNSEEIKQTCKKELEKIMPDFLESMKNVTKMSLEAGCDIVLHCSGDLEEMEAVYKGLL